MVTQFSASNVSVHVNHLPTSIDLMQVSDIGNAARKIEVHMLVIAFRTRNLDHPSRRQPPTLYNLDEIVFRGVRILETPWIVRPA